MGVMLVEAQATGRLGSHPHVVTVFDLGEQEGQPDMATELMGGGVFSKSIGLLSPAFIV